MVPGLDRYVIGSRFDDFNSVTSFYGPATLRGTSALLHGLTTTPGMIGVICSGVAGGLIAVVVLLLTHSPPAAGVAGVAGFAAAFVLITMAAMRAVTRVAASFTPRFPRPDPDEVS
jgi:hypothetical protein